jgi:hypothetical protein
LAEKKHAIDLSADGLGDHDISELTGCGVDAVRRAIAEHPSSENQVRSTGDLPAL